MSEHLNSFTWTGLGAITLERFDDAIALLDRTIAAALATGQGHLPALMRINQAYAYLWLGRGSEAAARLGPAVETLDPDREPDLPRLGPRAAVVGGAAPRRRSRTRSGSPSESAAGAVSETDPITATAASTSPTPSIAAGRPDEAESAVARVRRRARRSTGSSAASARARTRS